MLRLKVLGSFSGWVAYYLRGHAGNISSAGDASPAGIEALSLDCLIYTHSVKFLINLQTDELIDIHLGVVRLPDATARAR